MATTKRFPVPPVDTPFLTRHEAAALLRQNIQVVDELIRREKLPAYRIDGSRRILIRRDELLNLVSESLIWKGARRG